MSELEMMVIPEHIEATGDYVIATYYLQKDATWIS